MPASDIGRRIAAEAETWIGTPFLWQARVKGVGVDCKGLVAGVATACGRPEGNSIYALAGDYADRVPVQRLIAGLTELFDHVGEIQTGDVLLLKVAGKPQHLAIAAPKEGRATRAVQAYHTGPRQVVAIGTPKAMIHSIWRWRD